MQFAHKIQNLDDSELFFGYKSLFRGMKLTLNQWDTIIKQLEKDKVFVLGQHASFSFHLTTPMQVFSVGTKEKPIGVVIELMIFEDDWENLSSYCLDMQHHTRYRQQKEIVLSPFIEFYAFSINRIGNNVYLQASVHNINDDKIKITK